ncbi:MAG: hypothetical protein KJZ75_11385 [Hyphomonadaceae bacterium]|nr:hypothetical protein [Hyphomonadaceae bacterium]
MTTLATRPNVSEREKDEFHLSVLNCWDAGWSAGEIAKAFRVSRCIPLGVIFRINQADPGALERRPQPYRKSQLP